MELFILAWVLWYAFGVFVYLRTCWVMQGFLLGSDLVMAVLAGLFGPANLIHYFRYAKQDFYERRFLVKKD